MRLILIRHGETPANVLGSLDTALPGPGLTDRGREQAAAIPAALEPERIDRLFVSRAIRTHETIAPLAQALGLEPTVLAGAHEIQAGALEKRTDPDSVHTYLRLMGRWADGHLADRVPGGESGHDVLERFDESVRQIEETGAQTAVLISHGAAIRFWTFQRGTNLAGTDLHEEPLPNTGIVVLEGNSDDGWSVMSWLDTALAGTGPDDTDLYDGPQGHPFEE
ncbi:histidine phosphatase family protein [Yimella sp. cx-51]|uniref:histidine phosphatase family protein n=1 Tax=Yimella sp. cx-51 TaxID=2770551 RepID=UPI00165E463F|nr:histidine phosphatase family protein [Yimella sp. cx-51]MBC9955599.1 histidine phosphatase family protein [Yimella sp. cx-51]QTH37825.1 histidine phosphatase family protein [Yimella sp. cx-51]